MCLSCVPFQKLLHKVMLLSAHVCMHCIYADPANAAVSQANKEDIDSRSVFVGNVSTKLPLT